MCGIAGVLGPDATEGEARRMIAPLAHRGPDGVRVEALEGAALAHARLSIIDLACGWQPLHAAGSTLIGNGEIYNYLELTEQFGLAGALTTGSDFEPLLHLYAREGPAAFARLRGMYAFCLIGGDGRAWRVRDPFGIKPLYVAGARFASEPRALGPLGLSPEQAQELLALNYVVSDARRLAPGAVQPVRAGHARRRICPSPAGAGANVRPRRPARRRRRCARWTRCWRTACACTSAPTCPTACSCRAGSTRRRSPP